MIGISVTIEDEVYTLCPCPFCGNGTIGFWIDKGNVFYWVICGACNARGPGSGTKEGAIATWNGSILDRPKL